MTEKNEIVVVELDMSTRLRIYGQITGRMEELGFSPVDFSELDLGFDVPGGWPVDKDAAPTLAELVVLANKLKLRITIADINLTPME